MEVAVSAWNDGPRQRAANGLVVRPAEDLFCLSIPACDQAVLIGGDHGTRRGVDDELQMPLRFLEPLHDAQLHFGLSSSGDIKADGADEEHSARQNHQCVPDVPESVVARPHEEEDRRLHRHQHQADDRAGFDPAVGTATLPVTRGGHHQGEERHGLQQRVEIREPSIDDQRRQSKGEASREDDAQAGEPEAPHDRTGERASWICKRTRASEKNPHEQGGHADVSQVKEVRGGLCGDEGKAAGKYRRKGQHVREPDRAERRAGESQRQQATVPANHDVHRAKEEGDRQGDDHRHVEGGHIPGERQGAVRQEGSQRRHEHQDRHRQQCQQATASDPFETRQEMPARSRNQRRNQHDRNMRRSP